MPSGYRMQISPLALDCVRFEQLLREGRAAQAADNAQLAVAILTRGLALWRGPALVDVSYDEFAAAEAARLDEVRLDCFEARLAALLALGENDDALAEAARLSAEHPHRERLRGLHMVALYRAGRQVEALEVFRQARDSLIDELGLEPAPTSEQSSWRFSAKTLALAPQPVPQESATLMIPAALTSLVGREEEIRDLRDLVLRTDIRLVTLVGAGGSGKTRLALALASESQTVLCERHHDRRAVRSTRPCARPARHRSGAPCR